MEIVEAWLNTEPAPFWYGEDAESDWDREHLGESSREFNVDGGTNDAQEQVSNV